MPQTKKQKIEFFGPADKNMRGEISSSVPAWMMEQHIEELEESIGMKERALRDNRLPVESRPYAEAELKNERLRLHEILDSKPMLSGQQKDEVAKARELLAQQITETMPTLREDREGFVRPHDEYNRLKGRHIKIEREMASALGIKPQDGKITGDQANRAYRILSAALGEDANIEKLRRDYGHASYRTMDPMTQEILKNGR